MKKVRFLLVNIFFALLLVSCFDRTDDCVFSDASPRASSNAISHLENLWNKKISLYGHGSWGNKILLVGDLLIVSDGACERLRGLDSNSGSGIWRIELTNADLYASSPTNIYATNIWGASTEIININTKDANIVWENDDLYGERVGLNLFKDTDGNLNVFVGYLGRENHVRQLEVATGEFLGDFKQAKDAFFLYDGVFFSYIDNCIITTESANMETRWTSCQPIEIDLPPLIYENLLILKGAYSDQTLFAIDRMTGDLSWSLKHKGIISNIELDTSRLYFLDTEQTLHIIDAATGQIIKQVFFYQVDTADGEFSDDSWISVDGDKIAIYFPDTLTLSVYRLK